MDEHVAKMKVQCNNYFTNDLNIARRTVKCYKIFRMIQILRMEEPVTKRTVQYDNYFTNDLDLGDVTFFGSKGLS